MVKSWSLSDPTRKIICNTAQPEDFQLGLAWIRDLVAKLVETIVS